MRFIDEYIISNNFNKFFAIETERSFDLFKRVRWISHRREEDFGIKF